MKRNTEALQRLGRQRLKELRAKLAEIRKEMGEIEARGLIAAKGTAIASYKARSGGGEYWDYFKLIRGKNEPLIHLGKEGSEWVALFREAITRRGQLDILEKQRSSIKKEIEQIKAAIAEKEPPSSLS